MSRSCGENAKKSACGAKPSACCAGAGGSTGANSTGASCGGVSSGTGACGGDGGRPLTRFSRMIGNCLDYATAAKAAGRPVVGILRPTPRR
jgi:hypothetical protein